MAAYRGDMSAADYLAGATDGDQNREIALEELLMIWLANGNPAFAPLRRAVRRCANRRAAGLSRSSSRLRQRLQDAAGFGPDNDDLITLLRKPALEAPVADRTAALDRAALGLRRGALRRSAGHLARRHQRRGSRGVDALQPARARDDDIRSMPRRCMASTTLGRRTSASARTSTGCRASC